MLGRMYIVAKGDNLWNIAERNLGGGSQWPRIYRYNNRSDVTAVTGGGIKDPDIIHIGQKLLLPIAPGVQPTEKPFSTPSQALPQSGSLSRELPSIESPVSFKYRLDDLRLPPIDVGSAIIEYRMSGDVLLRSSRSYPATYVTSRRELEAQATNELNHAFGKLVSDNRFIYDWSTKQVTVRTMMVSQSKTPNAPATAIGFEMSSNSPIPKLRAEIRLPKLEGSIGPVPYVALDVKFVVEITPKIRPPTGLSPQPVRVWEPARARSTDWSVVIGTGLIVTAGVIVVGTIVEDVLTGGVGIADDPASFSAAAAAFVRGIAMVRGPAVMLPRAVAGTVTVGTALQVAP